MSLQIPQQLLRWSEPQADNVIIASGSFVLDKAEFILITLYLVSDTDLTFSEPDSGNASWVWPGGSDWQFVKPGESIISDCKNWYSTTE